MNKTNLICPTLQKTFSVGPPGVKGWYLFPWSKSEDMYAFNVSFRDKDMHVNASWHCWTVSGTCPQSVNALSDAGGNLHAVATGNPVPSFSPWSAPQEEGNRVAFHAECDNIPKCFIGSPSALDNSRKHPRGISYETGLVTVRHSIFGHQKLSDLS